MNGIVLWYKCDKKTGLVWCEDQGPLACITSSSELGDGMGVLEAGDQIVFESDELDGMRVVKRLVSLRRSAGSLDVQALLSAEAARVRGCEDVKDPVAQNGGHLRVVA
ncbi:hypothetical protein [Aliiroseovarius crassostreae]|uniref:hypothetical protein n=1 Tax=Aliiroseovarius crassostreae TaxID=154981 RepID=UPI003C7D4352